MAVFRVEKNRDYTVMSNYHLKDKDLSLKSKGLLSVILSLPDEWDYSTRGLSSISKEGVDSIGTALKELEKTGYLSRHKLRDERGRITDTEYVIYEHPQPRHDVDEPDKALPDTPPPYTGNPDTVKPHTEKAAQYNTNQVITDLSKPYESNINPSITHKQPQTEGRPSKSSDRIDCDPIDEMDSYNIYRDILKENIDYDYLCQQHPHNIQDIDEIVELMLDTICSKRRTIRVAGEDKPGELVRSRIFKLESEHIDYVLECLQKNNTDIRNIKSYLITSLYNAPSTISSYYRAAVNRDLYGSK